MPNSRKHALAVAQKSHLMEIQPLLFIGKGQEEDLLTGTPVPSDTISSTMPRGSQFR